MHEKISTARREFIKSGLLASGILCTPGLLKASFYSNRKQKIKVVAHLWQYASKFPYPYDCTPVLETVFSELSFAGLDGVELMDINLRHENSVNTINALIKKYNFPVSGTSYGIGIHMWDAGKHTEILTDVQMIVSRLKEVKGRTFGISVGDAGHIKTEAELDAQAAILKKVITVCNENGIQPNLHNHTYEVNNGMHDLKGTLARIPGVNLGPDINWLIRAGIDPVDFINAYGKQIVYLHLRDQDAQGIWTEYVGQGVTDFAAVAKALKKQGFEGTAAIELAYPPKFEPANDLKTDWKISREYIKKTFNW